MRVYTLYMALLALGLFSCSTDEPERIPTLVTPAIDWHGSALYDDLLLISVAIESNQDLPPGILHFQANGLVTNKYLPLKGEQRLLTNYKFMDYEVQHANLVYHFSDKREPSITSYALQKVALEVREVSVDADWKDY